MAILAVFLFSAGTITAQKETRDVATFTEVSFGISGNLYIKQGSKQSLVLEGEMST